jgi:arabinose-5-phosphate isomerase
MATKPMTPLALARQVLDIELAGLKAVRSQLDAQFTAAVEILAKALAERNKLVVVGIGKSGNIGQKIAATFNSQRAAWGYRVA